MPFPSKFAVKCKDCGSPHNIGDQIEKNNNGNYCRNGKNCQGVIQTQSTVNVFNRVSNTCSNATVSVITIPTFKRQHVTDEEEILWNSILDKIIEYDILADMRLKQNQFFDDTNPAHNGQVKNFAFAVQQEIKKLQREETS